MIPFFCDLGRIQTYNLLSRNQMHYSVMLRGLNILIDIFIVYTLINPASNLELHKTDLDSVFMRIYYIYVNQKTIYLLLCQKILFLKIQNQIF